MPMLPGSQRVAGSSPPRYRLPSGEVVTRWQARNRGAQAEGFKNETARRAAKPQRDRDSAYVKRFRSSELGKAMEARARAEAQQSGRRFNEAEWKTRIIQARNERPTSKNGGRGGEHYQDFSNRYGGKDHDWGDSG